MGLVFELIRNAFKRSATLRYPDKPRELPEGFRGMLSFSREECKGCGLCWRVCPASAIEASRDEGGPRPRFLLYKCTFCYLCVEVCPTKAIKPTKVFERIAFRKEELVEG